MKLAPKTAVIEKDGVETTVPIAQVKKGDISWSVRVKIYPWMVSS